MAHLESALAELPPLTRSVFLLFHFDKLSVPTIAARTSLSTRTIERHLARALAHCAEQIEPFL
jgi:RNA polymerase sigma-70 factor (ECF subfamily)